MGRTKKEPADRPKYLTAGFYAEEISAIKRTMDDLGISQSAAIRLLVRRGSRSTAQPPDHTDKGE
jgi:hypothetical protein